MIYQDACISSTSGIEEEIATFWNLSYTIKWVRGRDPNDLRLSDLYLDMDHLRKIAADRGVRQRCEAMLAEWRDVISGKEFAEIFGLGETAPA